MSEEFEKRLDFDSDTFAEMKMDMNFVLQRLRREVIQEQRSWRLEWRNVSISRLSRRLRKSRKPIGGNTYGTKFGKM